MFSPDRLSCSKKALGYVLNSIFAVLFGASCIVFFVLFAENDCSSHLPPYPLTVSTWILGAAILFLSTLLLKLPIFWIDTKIGAFLYYFCLYFLTFPSNLAWSVIGGIVLFRSNCFEEESLWIFTLSTLIAEWLLIITHVWEIIQKA